MTDGKISRMQVGDPVDESENYVIIYVDCTWEVERGGSAVGGSMGGGESVQASGSKRTRSFSLSKMISDSTPVPPGDSGSKVFKLGPNITQMGMVPLQTPHGKHWKLHGGLLSSVRRSMGEGRGLHGSTLRSLVVETKAPWIRVAGLVCVASIIGTKETLSVRHF